jgi:AcrR family transcriptional regulator
MWHSVSLGVVCHNAPVSRRDLHKQRTRQAIADAGIQLFLTRGFDAVTVADIAEAADVAPRTFHRYFRDRDELLFADEAENREYLRAALAAHPFDPTRPLAALGAVLGALAARFDGGLAAARVRHRLIAASPALHARDLTKQAYIETELAGHLAGQLGVPLDADVRPRLWAKLGLACFFTAYQVWVHEGGELADHIERALGALPSS